MTCSFPIKAKLFVVIRALADRCARMRAPGLLAIFVAGIAGAQEYRLPFDGRWFTLQAGDTINVNAHMAVAAQAFGIDFGKVGGPSGRELLHGSAADPANFFCWNAEVLAPVDGDVVDVADDWPDNAVGTKDPAHPLGNHVVIRAAADQYVFLAHFRHEPARVMKGQHVVRGQAIGRCGNSGNSDFPHVHMHVQDGPTLNEGEGRNIVFSRIDVELAGKAFSNVDWPLIRGLWIANH